MELKFKKASEDMHIFIGSFIYTKNLKMHKHVNPFATFNTPLCD